MHQSLIADGSDGAACVAADVLGTFDVACHNLLVDVAHHLLSVDFGQCQVDEPLDAESEAEHKSQGYERHEACAALNEFGLEPFVEPHALHAFGNHVSRRS